MFALQLSVVGGIARNRVRAQQVAETGWPARRSGACPIKDEIESRLVELLKQVFRGTICRELEPQPWETIASARRGVGQARQRFRESAAAVLDACPCASCIFA
jgi:hypothetical protein